VAVRAELPDTASTTIGGGGVLLATVTNAVATPTLSVYTDVAGMTVAVPSRG
jgi:hypothetical protein